MSRSSLWMRIAVVVAAAHGFYTAFQTDSLESRALWIAVSLGLLLSSRDPVRYWPAVLAGLTARALPAVSFALADQSRPMTGTLADAAWWAPLSFILASAYFSRLDQLRERSPEILTLALRTRTDRGISLDQLSRLNPVLLVFLRDAGCTFCRETLADLAAQRSHIEATGATIVLAHMAETECGCSLFRKYGLEDVHHISDPKRSLYRAFGLRRGDLRMMFGPKVWMRGIDAGILQRHGVGRSKGNGSQMPGVFLIFHGQVIRSYRHQSVADRPNYVRFLNEDTFSRTA